MLWKLEKEFSKKLQVWEEPTDDAALHKEDERLDSCCQGPKEKASWPLDFSSVIVF